MKTIKNTILILASFSFVFLSSCDMDKYPHGVLPEEGGIQSAATVGEYINGLYNDMRFLTTGPFVVYGDVQTDCYHAVLGNGGLLNSLYSGILQPQMTEFETIWNGYYSVIGSTNYIIGNIKRLQEDETLTWTEREENLLKNYLGDAYFFRAFCYFELAQRFCAAYHKDTANQPHSGVPISLVYNPTSSSSTYLGRNTLEEVYQQILTDLEEATTLLEKYGPYPTGLWSEAPYFTINTAKAMKARVSLSMREFKTAFDVSKALITSRHYSLVRNQTSLNSIWAKDTGTEIIMLMDMTWEYTGYSTGEYFKSIIGNPIFIPTAEAVALFNARDRRHEAFLDNDTINIEGSNINVIGMNKYPGNPILYVSNNNFKNMSKPFHIAEQYLIAAESAYELGDPGAANDYLNTLRSSRFENHVNQTYIGNELIAEIRKERRRELYGEGFRLSDLKRWGMGFSRSAPQNSNVVNNLGGIDRITYEPGDYRFIWPIPKGEMDANPQLKGQQNKGY